MRKLVVAMLVVVAMGLAGAGALAEVPTLIPVVGVLADEDDVPLDGDFDVVFTLYTSETGGVTLWGETQNVEFVDGLFRAYLGAATLDGLDVADFIANDEVWLGVRVGSDNEMNRVRLASVPWAFEAATCGQVTDLPAAGIQQAIGADACGADQAMRGWTGSAAVCVDLPDISGLVADADIGTAVQAPIDQSNFPCNYGIQQISAAGAVVCVNQDVVTQCGPEAGLGSNDNYLGSDGACHKAAHSCTENQYLAGGAAGACQEAPHKCTASQYLDGDGTCRTAPHVCGAGQVMDGTGACHTVVPAGGIIMWSGAVASIPAGWQLCNGTNGTPNLMDRFIVGAGSAYAVGGTGGAGTVTLTTAQMPAHNHTMGTAGAHTHSVPRYADGAWDWGSVAASGNWNNARGYENTTSNGDHTHTINSSGNDGAHENRPPYYALAYIMRMY